MVSLVDGKTVEGAIELSPFNCSGGGINSFIASHDRVTSHFLFEKKKKINFTLAGRTEFYTATFRNKDKSYGIGLWKITHLSFEFRTYMTEAFLISSVDQKLDIRLHHRHLHLLLFGNNITVTSHSRFNRLFLNFYWNDCPYFATALCIQ